MHSAVTPPPSGSLGGSVCCGSSLITGVTLNVKIAVIDIASVYHAQPAHASFPHADAAAAVDSLMHYCDQATEDDLQPLCIQRRVDLLRVAAQKQSSVMEFFTAVTN